MLFGRNKNSLNRIALWGGWSIELPVCEQVRNEDGSWSAWGQDWAVDIHIVETSGKSDGSKATKEELLGPLSGKENISGTHWIGSMEILREIDNGRPVFRLATKLCTDNTFMSCWVSYFRQDQEIAARSWIVSVAHKGK
jgi:hypothetical protein